MQLRFAAVLLLCGSALAQPLTVDRLEEFLRSAAQTKEPDREIARYLAKTRLSEKLDDGTIQKLQAEGVVQPQTLHALWALRDASATLPPAKPHVVTTVRVQPPPSNEEQGRIIQEVREYALNYSRNLPDFICAEEVKRYEAPMPHNGESPSWHAGDILLIQLNYFQQKEAYKLRAINYIISDQDYEKVGGAKEFGSFGTLMRGIFEPSSEARFDYDRSETIPGRAATLVFRYTVELGRSNYELDWENSLRIRTAYHGLVWVAKDSHAVLRVTVEADHIPDSFPIRAAKTQLDYDFAELSGNKFLLPASAQVIMAEGDRTTRNDERFVSYRKYVADAVIKFDQ